MNKSMPEYQCHKKVKAAKISRIERAGTNYYEIIFSGKIDSIDVDKSFIEKHNPEVGGYFVIYEDGYQSYSPAKSFESGYSKI